MRRDEDKIRVQIDSTVGDFKAIIDALDRYIADGYQKSLPQITRFKQILQQQVMKD